MITVPRTKYGLHRRDEGVAAVEFALVVPILLLLVFGIIGFGTLFGQQLALNNGIRQGARLEIVPGASSSTCAQLIQAVQDASVPSVGLVQTGIGVQIATVRGSTVTYKCGTSATTFLTTSTSGVKPCTGSLNALTSEFDSIRVVSTYQSTVLGALPAFCARISDEQDFRPRGSSNANSVEANTEQRSWCYSDLGGDSGRCTDRICCLLCRFRIRILDKTTTSG